MLCGRNAVQVAGARRPIDLEELRRGWRRSAEVRANEYALRFSMRALRDDDLSGRPRDHQGHQRHRCGAKLVRALHRYVNYLR